MKVSTLFGSVLHTIHIEKKARKCNTRILVDGDRNEEIRSLKLLYGYINTGEIFLLVQLFIWFPNWLEE